jgi:hypothetical protein
MAKRGMQGTKDRVDRVKQRKSGQWASVSPDCAFTRFLRKWLRATAPPTVSHQLRKLYALGLRHESISACFARRPKPLGPAIFNR